MNVILAALVLVTSTHALACDPVATATDAAKADAIANGAVSVSISARYSTEKIFGEPAAIVHYAFSSSSGSVFIGKAIVDLMSCSVERTSSEPAQLIKTQP